MIFVVVSTGHFDPLIKECMKLSGTYSFEAQIGMGRIEPTFPHFRMASPEEIEKKMRAAELVITHGGTGMLSMLYRLQKPMIVCHKQRRYGEANNSQVELAKKWCELGMGLLCMDLRDLEKTIQKAKTTKFQFPKMPPLGRSLGGQMGILPVHIMPRPVVK